MDKYEYKVRADEIKALISEGEFAEAVSIADTIDWRRVKSVMMLCTISDLYKINRRYQESKDILLLAYEKHPTGRLIVYSLCELSIKMEEYVDAIEYYKEFVRIAPKDTGRYILQYRLYEAQDVSLEERIAVLEEFKKRDYREKWAYELAYLYHRIGLATKCVEECDEMYLWFGEGKHVIKALELKALHEPLSAEQQAKYDAWITERDAGDTSTEEEDSEEVNDIDDALGDTRVVEQIKHAQDTDEQAIAVAPTTELPEVKTVDVGQYNTINLQMALAESMKEILEDDTAQESPDSELPAEDEEADETDVDTAEAEESVPVVQDSEESADAGEEEPDDEEEEPEETSIAESLIAPLLEETVPMPEPEEIEEHLSETPVIPFPEQPQFAEQEETESAFTELEFTGSELAVPESAEHESTESEFAEPESTEAESALIEPELIIPDEDIAQYNMQPEESDRPATIDTDELWEVSTQIAQEDTLSLNAQQILEQISKPSKYDSFLSQEYDGQISLVMPEATRVEKQITGQLSIDDIMAEWEEMKRTSEQRRMEEVRQRILAHTGNLFADFDEATKNGLLEELERAFVAAIMKDSDQKPAIKQVILPDDDDKINSALDAVKSEAEQLVANVSADVELSEDDIDDGVEELEEIEEPVDEEGMDTKPVEEAPDTSEQLKEDSPTEEASVQGDATREDSVQESAQDRALTREELALFGQFAHHRRSIKQLTQTLDNMSLAPYTGNVIITGEEELTTMTLAKALIKEMQLNDNNFSGKVAKISANVLNKKDVAETFARLDNGALIIEKASRLKPLTVSKMTKVLEKDNMGLLIIIIDKKSNINRLLADQASLNNNFNLRIDIEPLDDEALVAYAKQYAEEMEYSIDEFGILALHTRIADRQTSDHEVSMAEVRELVDEAIHYANKKTPRHFMDILLAKRYDDEDMIILREKDFMHY
ncbi:MAG: hypothetical protein J1F18_09875 [Lachnospiraceae bacterium]|nr:hypothetical protein [Lachnospiraceae bacterium]